MRRPWHRRAQQMAGTTGAKSLISAHASHLAPWRRHGPSWGCPGRLWVSGQRPLPWTSRRRLASALRARPFAGPGPSRSYSPRREGPSIWLKPRPGEARPSKRHTTRQASRAALTSVMKLPYERGTGHDGAEPALMPVARARGRKGSWLNPAPWRHAWELRAEGTAAGASDPASGLPGRSRGLERRTPTRGAGWAFRWMWCIHPVPSEQAEGRPAPACHTRPSRGPDSCSDRVNPGRSPTGHPHSVTNAIDLKHCFVLIKLAKCPTFAYRKNSIL